MPMSSPQITRMLGLSLCFLAICVLRPNELIPPHARVAHPRNTVANATWTRIVRPKCVCSVQQDAGRAVAAARDVPRGSPDLSSVYPQRKASVGFTADAWRAGTSTDPSAVAQRISVAAAIVPG